MTPSGYIIIKHQVFKEISDQEVTALLPMENGIPVYKIFDIKREIIGMDEIHKLDSYEFRIYQKNIMDNEILPYIHANPNYKVWYFGAAPIPLALHLGFCFGSWNEVDVFLYNRETMQWNWPNDSTTSLTYEKNFIGEQFSAPIEVVYNVEATYHTVENEINQVTNNASKTIDLRLNPIGKDVFRNQTQIKQFAHEFSLGLDSIANNLPNTDKIHLIATVPVGLAFLMGTKINPNVTKPIITYQYNTNNLKKYEPILTLQEMPNREFNMTEEDIEFIKEVKAKFNTELTGFIAAFVNGKSEELEKVGRPLHWTELVLPAGDYEYMKHGAWQSLADISKTILGSSSISNETALAGDGFHISEKNEWQILDRFIFNIKNRLGNDLPTVLRALRLFIFHESFHIHQGLTNYTASNIGRFPRVLEEADYVADVWAMIHEYSYSKTYYPTEVKNEKEFFLQLIDIATKTMWAFDDIDPNNDEMQVRRVNRYLIWYWNYLLIEDRSCTSLTDVIKILSNKPILEIRGIDIRAQLQRTIYKLTSFTGELELAYFSPTGDVKRISNSGGIQIEEIVHGFIERNGERILQQLKSWLHQIRG